MLVSFAGKQQRLPQARQIEANHLLRSQGSKALMKLSASQDLKINQFKPLGHVFNMMFTNKSVSAFPLTSYTVPPPPNPKTASAARLAPRRSGCPCISCRGRPCPVWRTRAWFVSRVWCVDCCWLWDGWLWPGRGFGLLARKQLIHGRIHGPSWMAPAVCKRITSMRTSRECK